MFGIDDSPFEITEMSPDAHLVYQSRPDALDRPRAGVGKKQQQEDTRRYHECDDLITGEG